MMNVIYTEDGGPDCQIEAIEQEDDETEEAQLQEWEEEQETPTLEAPEEEGASSVEALHHSSGNHGYVGAVANNEDQESDDDYSAYVPFSSTEIYSIGYMTAWRAETSVEEKPEKVEYTLLGNQARCFPGIRR